MAKIKKKRKIGKLFKKMKGTSNLEVEFGLLLDEMNISYTHHFVFKKREFDFLLDEYNIIIETHGCFFHCCKEHNHIAKYTFQKSNLKNDTYKKNLVKFDPTYRLLVVWEHEMVKRNLLTERITKFITKVLND